jgi:hypothetical protein
VRAYSQLRLLSSGTVRELFRFRSGFALLALIPLRLASVPAVFAIRKNGRAEKHPSSHWRRLRPVRYGHLRIEEPAVAAAAPWVNSGGVIRIR